MITNWVAKIEEKLKSEWYILLYLYLALSVTIYSGIWTTFQALDIKFDTLKYRNIFLSQAFLRIVSALIVTSIFCLLSLVLVLRRLIGNFNLHKYRGTSTRKILIMSGNPISTKLIDVAISLGHTVVALYDRNPDAEGILYARSKGISTYAHSPNELRKMLKITQDNKTEYYYIFITTEYANYLTRADETIRSLRRHSKNFRFYRLGIDFDESVNDVEIARLLV